MKKVTLITQTALPIEGFLRATWKFNFKYNGKAYSQNFGGGDTSSNCLRHKNQMFRQSMKDCKYQLFMQYGGSRNYTAELIYYSFHYWKDDYTGVKGQKKSIAYYSSQVPDAERNYSTYYERKVKVKQNAKTNKRKNKTVSKKVKTLGKNKGKLNNKNRIRTKNKSTRNIETARKIVTSKRVQRRNRKKKRKM